MGPAPSRRGAHESERGSGGREQRSATGRSRIDGLDIPQGAGKSTVDLSGDWARDLDGRIDIGAAELTVRLPKDVGVRVENAAGVGTINAVGLCQAGSVYTNAAHGVSDATLRLDIDAGACRVTLE